MGKTSHNRFDACPRCCGEKDSRAALCQACRQPETPVDQVDFIRENINTLSWREISNAIGRGLPAVRSIAARNGIAKAPGIAGKILAQVKNGGLSTEERFWKHVQRSDGCWIWTGRIDAYGYGIFAYDGESHRAHRYSYELNVGPIPEGLGLLHSCDNPPCVNPAHLRPGTQADNSADAVARKRTASGDGHWMKRRHEYPNSRIGRPAKSVNGASA